MKKTFILVLLCILSGISQAQTMTPADSIKLLQEFRLLRADRDMFFAIMDQGPWPGKGQQPGNSATRISSLELR